MAAKNIMIVGVGGQGSLLASKMNTSYQQSFRRNCNVRGI